MVVCAASEPEEALLLGGYTALMRDGRVTQFGPASETYRNPQCLTAARVFSDPPINAARSRRPGARRGWTAARPGHSKEAPLCPMGVTPLSSGRTVFCRSAW